MLLRFAEPLESAHLRGGAALLTAIVSFFASALGFADLGFGAVLVAGWQAIPAAERAATCFGAHSRSAAVIVAARTAAPAELEHAELLRRQRRAVSVRRTPCLHHTIHALRNASAVPGGAVGLLSAILRALAVSRGPHSAGAALEHAGAPFAAPLAQGAIGAAGAGALVCSHAAVAKALADRRVVATVDLTGRHAAALVRAAIAGQLAVARLAAILIGGCDAAISPSRALAELTAEAPIITARRSDLRDGRRRRRRRRNLCC